MSPRAGVLALLLASASASAADEFPVAGKSIAELQGALADGRTTSRALVTQYLVRIATHDRTLHAVVTVSPRALADADRLDRERAAGRLRGPLHGIPIAIKDNIQTKGLRTTAGTLAFADFVPAEDATLVANLRDAGAIVLAKTTLTELANWMTAEPRMPGSYNAVVGYGYNPYDPRPDPRAGYDGRGALPPSGSSSAAGTAADFWAANVGTETSGSILEPANLAQLAAVKPTVGRVSRAGVVPITADQDTPGPMAKHVADAALLLGAMEGRERDVLDPATTRCRPPRGGDYTRFLRRDGLRGARIGIPRTGFYSPIAVPGLPQPLEVLDAGRAKAMADAIAVLVREGAVVVDPAELPSAVDSDMSRSLVAWDVCGSMDELKERNCSVVLAYGMQRDFNAWLASLGDGAPLRSLTELRRWNRAHAARGTLRYGQTLLDFSDALDPETYAARYAADRAKDLELTAERGIDAALREHRLDALLFPGAGGSDVAARAGYPSVIVPFAFVPNAPEPPFPRGFDAKPAPFGVAFTGTACSEPVLLRLAYAFEQATKARVAPAGFD